MQASFVVGLQVLSFLTLMWVLDQQLLGGGIWPTLAMKQLKEELLSLSEITG